MKLKVGIKSFTVKTIPFLFKRENKSQVSSIPNKIKLTLKIKVVHMYMTD